ncbi:MAG: hypothetical protein JRH01_05940 [Deltaproteobacteria bacterium]|nr:hypothetical protein [Deltaproteobacteria bacterium]
MPLHFRIDEEAGLVITTAEGRVSAEDLVAHARELAKTPNRPLRELVDFSETVEITLPTEAVSDAAMFLRDEDQNAAGSRVAMVAKADAVFGMMRLFEAYRAHSGVLIRVFRNRDDALRWLAGEAD